MPDPIHDRDQLSGLLEQVAEAAGQYLGRVDRLPAGGPVGRDEAAGHFAGELPGDRNGSRADLTRLLTDGVQAAVKSAGPPFFPLVTRGGPPAALPPHW